MREVAALSFVSFFKYALVLDLAWFQFLFCSWHLRFYRMLLKTVTAEVLNVQFSVYSISLSIIFANDFL